MSLPEMPKGWRVIHFTDLDSTNSEAMRRAIIGESSCLLILSETHSMGRGRRNRSWLSQSGNLHCSVLVEFNLDLYWHFPFITSLSLISSIEIIVDDNITDLKCKWPNDIFYKNSKVAGILMEIVPGNKQLVIGIGVNLIPVNLATSIYDVGDLSLFKIDKFHLASVFCSQLEKWSNKSSNSGFNVIREMWLSRSMGLGKSITISLSDKKYTGIFRSLDSKGNLLLESQQGKIRRFTAGDIFVSAGE